MWASKPEQEVQKTKKFSMSPAQIKPSCSYSFVTQREPGVTYLPHLQSVCVQLTNTETLNNTNLHLPASTSSSAAPLQLQTETTFISEDLLPVSAGTSCAFINFTDPMKRSNKNIFSNTFNLLYFCISVH